MRNQGQGRQWAVVLLCASGVLAASGCVGSEPAVVVTPTGMGANASSSAPPPVPASSGSAVGVPVVTDPPKPVELAWSATTNPASDVVNVAGRAIVVASVDKHLEVQEINRENGRVQWAHRVSSSIVAPQVAMPITVLEDHHVAILEPLPGPGERARMRLLDVEQQGKPVADSGIYSFTSFPEVCDDDPKAVCATGVVGPKSYEVRLTTTYNAQRQLPAGDSYENLGVAGLVRFLEPKTRKSHIGVERKGKLVWHRPEQDVFGKLSPNAGWVFRSSGNVIRGTVSLPKAGRADQMPRRRLTVGIDAETGATRWRMPGADLGCSSRKDMTLLCRWQAGVVRADGFVEGGRMEVVRIDPVTGKQKWASRPLQVQGRDAGALGNSGDGVVVEEVGGRTYIDLATGEDRPAFPSDVTWRKRSVQVDSIVQHYQGNTPLTTRRAVVNQNEPVTDPERFFAPLPEGIGADFDGLRLLSLPGRIIALRTS